MSKTPPVNAHGYQLIVADTKAQAAYWAQQNYGFEPVRIDNEGPSRDGRRTFKCWKPEVADKS